jgi:hypothetical protein
MATITNTVKINTVEEFVAAAKEAKLYGTHPIWDIAPEVLREIMLSDVLEEIYGN